MRAVFLPLALPLLLGCGGGGGGASGGGSPAACTYPSLASPAPGATPSWSADLVPLFHASCGSATANCHGAGQSLRIVFDPSHSAATLYADLVNVPSPQSGWPRVKPGDAAGSWVYEKVTKTSPGGGGYGTQMPQTMPPLCSGAVDNLRVWINAGAPNN